MAGKCIYLSIIQADGMAAIRTPTSINDMIHELSSSVMGIGESSSCSFIIEGDPHPLAVPADSSSKVAVKWIKIILIRFKIA